MTRFVALAGISVVLLAAPLAAVAKDGDDEVRVKGVCGPGTTTELRVRADDDGLEVRFKVDYTRAGVVWRVVLVHERRIAWKGSARTGRPYGSFEVRRTLRDYSGADSVTARAWGPSGIVCRATATLPG